MYDVLLDGCVPATRARTGTTWGYRDKRDLVPKYLSFVFNNVEKKVDR